MSQLGGNGEGIVHNGHHAGVGLKTSLGHDHIRQLHRQIHVGAFQGITLNRPEMALPRQAQLARTRIDGSTIVIPADLIQAIGVLDPIQGQLAEGDLLAVGESPLKASLPVDSFSRNSPRRSQVELPPAFLMMARDSSAA